MQLLTDSYAGMNGFSAVEVDELFMVGGGSGSLSSYFTSVGTGLTSAYSLIAIVGLPEGPIGEGFAAAVGITGLASLGIGAVLGQIGL